MKAKWLAVGIIACLAGCAEKPAPEPAPDNSSLLKKIAETEYRLAGSLRKHEPVRMGAELHGELVAAKQLPQNIHWHVSRVCMYLGAMEVIDRERDEHTKYDPITNPVTMSDEVRRIRAAYSSNWNEAILACGEARRAFDSPKTAQASLAQPPGR